VAGTLNSAAAFSIAAASPGPSTSALLAILQTFQMIGLGGFRFLCHAASIDGEPPGRHLATATA
jgi:hypothetical protein